MSVSPKLNMHVNIVDIHATCPKMIIDPIAKPDLS